MYEAIPSQNIVINRKYRNMPKTRPITYRSPRTGLALQPPEGDLRCTDISVDTRFIEVMKQCFNTEPGVCLRAGCGAPKIPTPKPCKYCKLCSTGPELLGEPRGYYVPAKHVKQGCCRVCDKHKVEMEIPNGTRGYMVGTSETYLKPCCGTNCYQVLMRTLENHGISFGDHRTKLSLSPRYVKPCGVCHEAPRRVEYDLVMVTVDGVIYEHPVVFGFVKRHCSSKCALEDTAFPFVVDNREYRSVNEYSIHNREVSKSRPSSLENELKGFAEQFRYYKTIASDNKYYPLVNYRQTFLYEHLFLT